MTQYHYGNFGFIQHEQMAELPLILLDTGIEKRTDISYHYDNSHRLSYGGYLIQYTLKGCGIYEEDRQKTLLQPGMGFFAQMPQNSSYYLPQSPENQEWEFFYLHFNGSAARAFWNTCQTQAGSVFTLPLDSSPILLYFQFFENYRRNGSLALYESSEFLYRFLAQLLRELETPHLNESHLIVQAMQYIRQHFATLESISQVADACNISHEHLTRCFRKETGQTPLQYLTKLRIEHALSLLLNTSDSIEQIAMNCGFQNGNYFAKVFRKYMQCTPEEYRRRNG